MTDLESFIGMLNGLPAYITNTLGLGIVPLEQSKDTVVAIDKPTMEISFRFDKDGKLVDVLGRGKNIPQTHQGSVWDEGL
jgi:hypothetical protein